MEASLENSGKKHGQASPEQAQQGEVVLGKESFGSSHSVVPSVSVNGDNASVVGANEMVAREKWASKLSMAMDPRDFVTPRLALWNQKLSDAGVKDFCFGSGGAVEAGLYEGRKSRSHSTNPECPFEWVREFDGRIYIKNADVHDLELIRTIERATGLQADMKTHPATCQRWGNTVPLTRFFGYERLSANEGFEYEICLIPADNWLEVADYWKVVFSPEEISNQREIRTILRAANADYKTEYDPLKQVQCEESCWRIVAGFALGQWLKGREHIHLDGFPTDVPANPRQVFISHVRPFDGPVPELISHLVEAFLDGKSGGSGLDRPNTFFHSSSHPYLVTTKPSILAQPAQEPGWVTFAYNLQCALKDGATYSRVH